MKAAASYVFAKYPGKVANIMMNWVAFERKREDYVVAKGKWDAAFRYSGNPSVGFDFRDSPFGKDYFDHSQYLPEDGINYEDVYTGFIFYKPIEEWVLAGGIPGVVDECFLPEFKRRWRMRNEMTNDPWKIDDHLDEYIEGYSKKNVWSYDYTGSDRESVESYINYWLE